MDSYHGRLLDGAEAVDENVHSVFHGDSWIQKEERYWVRSVFTRCRCASMSLQVSHRFVKPSLSLFIHTAPGDYTDMDLYKTLTTLQSDKVAISFSLRGRHCERIQNWSLSPLYLLRKLIQSVMNAACSPCFEYMISSEVFTGGSGVSPDKLHQAVHGINVHILRRWRAARIFNASTQPSRLINIQEALLSLA